MPEARSSLPLLLLAFLLPFAPASAEAGSFPFTGTLEVVTSVGARPGSSALVSVAVNGTADVTAGVVLVPAGEISAVLPSLSGFSGTLVNEAGSFFTGGAGPGSSCPLVEIQEICIQGGGFGGQMAMKGALHAGQALEVWGSSATHLGMTSAGLSRTEAAMPFTAGTAAVWYYVPETDPTPFTIAGSGTFRGLPSTFTGTGAAGFSLVTPMMVTADLPVSAHNVRAIATLRIHFQRTPRVPTGAALLLAAALGVAGVRRLSRDRDAPTRAG
jgi:hypothetical protein